MSSNQLIRMKKEYAEKYSYLPDTQEEQLEFIRKHYKIDMNKVAMEIERIQNISWNTVDLTLYMIPKSTPRPRSNGKHFYVKGAKVNKEYMQSIVTDFNIICTRTYVDIHTYQPIPYSSLSNTEIYLAQLGLIRPQSDPDWDNLAKTYCDMMTDVLLINDNIIYKGKEEKSYSIKPKIDIKIRYQDTFDSKFNQRKMINSIAYKKYIDKGGKPSVNLLK